MSWNYENYLIEKLGVINSDNSFNMEIEVSSEQAFTKDKNFAPNTIYVVVKRLSSQMSYSSETTPVQILCLCEQNSLDKAKALFDKFAEENNWKSEKIGTTYLKQQYTKPVVLSNFNEVGYGYRSVIYISGTLYTMENVLDVRNLKVKVGNSIVSVDPLSFNLNYTMQGNTQPIGSDLLSSTVKSIATVNIAFVVALTSNAYINKILEITSGSASGNTTFTISFTLGDSATPIEYDMKLTSCVISNAPNQVPGLQVGFMR